MLNGALFQKFSKLSYCEYFPFPVYKSNVTPFKVYIKLDAQCSVSNLPGVALTFVLNPPYFDTRTSDVAKQFCIKEV